MPASSDFFYSNLPANHIPLSTLLIQDHLFYRIPEDWFVIITDIKNSTPAVSAGMHETVNLIATGSIVTVLNLVYKAGVTVPFFFGGDGATFIVPPSIIESAMGALQLFRTNTLQNFNLDLRVGSIAVSSAYEKGHELQISKFESSKTMSIPIILGTGLSYAEAEIKGEGYLDQDRATRDAELDLTGMMCRWDKIDPPEDHHEIVTLLVIAAADVKQAEAFRKVILMLDDIYGTPEKRQPISVSKLKLKTTFKRIEMELRARLSSAGVFKTVSTWLTYLLGYIYFKTRKGKDYLIRLVNMSDTLVMDGKINTVISGTEKQRIKLEAALAQLEQEGDIRFGLCVSKGSVMSCYVRDFQDDHIHFVDGAEGGYTNAATALKIKLKNAFN